MKEQFIDWNPTGRSLYLVQEIEKILDDYEEMGFTLTLRQLYYQLVSRDIIPNKDTEYNKLSALLTNARLAGLIDWTAIEDRIRVPRIPYWVTGVQEAIQDTVNQYRLNLQRGQDKTIEVWLEKDALSAIVYPITSKYHIRLMVNRGYSSITAMYDAAQRLQSGDVILYLGDHDPSGLDMVRDIAGRLETFGKDIEVVPIALTMAQVTQFNPPPNPAKITDTRASEYIRKHGPISWELDALSPQYLQSLVRNAIESRIDLWLFKEMEEQQRKDIEQLKSFIQ